MQSAGTGSQVMKVEHMSDNVSVTVKRDRKKARKWRTMKGEWMEEIYRRSEFYNCLITISFIHAT